MIYSIWKKILTSNSEAKSAAERENMCIKCGMSKENIEYWDTHQTMSDYKVWCTK